MGLPDPDRGNGWGIDTRYQRGQRKAVTTVSRRFAAVASPGRVASWIRKDYPKDAPERGHNYLVALCGMEYAAR